MGFAGMYRSKYTLELYISRCMLEIYIERPGLAIYRGDIFLNY